MSGEVLTIPSFGKINLHLQVIGRRPDGFHDLCTVFQTISIHDTIIVEPAEAIEFSCDDETIPVGEGNIMVRAANALRDLGNCNYGANICLEKRIPSPGGLGGGSSNAAVVLLALRKLWKLDVELSKLHKIAESLGSDVPFFLYGGTALGMGRGEIVEQIDDFCEKYMLIVTPNVAVATRDAFKRLQVRALTKQDSERILRLCRLDLESADFKHTAFTNDFETTVFATYPEVERVKQTLLDLDADRAMLSGSGGSVFAVFDKEETRQTAMKALDDEVNWRKFAVATISRNEYREALKEVF
ncbi:MAG TPA: 4-(cytidine 5'-diphospho)-2-C-methyl-D-erythritol kinase [Pyrinomonadaceae bacterium]|nr:4-(cytidine 5'-diphospho)-2-C-methyl-D-erythritol kinase [Pyrinomonadaceae bacterium]